MPGLLDYQKRQIGLLDLEAMQSQGLLGMLPPPRNPARMPAGVENFAADMTVNPLWELAQGAGAAATGNIGAPEVGVGAMAGIGLMSPGARLGRAAMTKPANYSQPSIRAYHGSTDVDGPFHVRHGGELGPHFGTLEQASDRIMYAHDPWNKKDSFKEGARVVPVDISARNPIEMRDLVYWEPANVLNEMGKLKTDAGDRIFGSQELSPVWSLYRQWKKSAPTIPERDPLLRDAMLDGIRARFSEKGFDAIKYQNQWEGRTGRADNVAYIPLQTGTVSSSISGQTLYGAAGAAGASPFAAALADALARQPQSQ